MFNAFRKYSTTFGVFISVLLVIASVPFQLRIENIRGEFDIIRKSLFLSSSTLKKMSLGYNLLVADIYWIRALQYFSATDYYLDKPEELFNYFDIITDLDPKFVNAYRFGGTFLAEPPDLGLGEIELGVRLLDKGRLNNPKNFRLVLDEAFIYYIYTNNFKRASELFEEASEKQSLSELRKASIKGMAALALTKSGNLELSKKIWTYIYKTSSVEGRKEHALSNLKEIETTEYENELTRALRSYYDDNKRLPNEIEALVERGYISKVPEDPYGGNFIIQYDSKKVVSNKLAKKQYEYAIRFLNSRSKKFNNFYGRYAKDLDELKAFVNKSPFNKFPENPYGRAFVYDSLTGRVK
jgi:hypothetical protein